MGAALGLSLLQTEPAWPGLGEDEARTLRGELLPPLPMSNRGPLLSQKQAFTDVATGSLGQGLGAACGMAYTGKYFDKAR